MPVCLGGASRLWLDSCELSPRLPCIPGTDSSMLGSLLCLMLLVTPP